MSKIITDIITKIYRWWSPLCLAVISLPIYWVKYRRYRAVSSFNNGFVAHGIERKDSGLMMNRLLNAYLMAKNTQQNVSKTYQVGHLWQGILDKKFRKIMEAARGCDLTKLEAILQNFNREECGEDNCGGHLFYHRMKTTPFYKYQFINAWYQRYNALCGVVGKEPILTNTLVGNPVGLEHNGQVIPLTYLEYQCYTEKIKSLLFDIKNPVICEIGGGVGGQAYSLINNLPSTYIILDIPEVLLIASYFLMSAFPEKKVLLYGEEEIPADLNKYDIVLMPNFVLPQLKAMTVDLFFNSCSFSEMNYETVEDYLKNIEVICKKYLLHINHTARLVWYEDKKRITNMISTEVVPNPTLFKKIYQKPRLFSLLEDEFVIHLYYKARYYEFLYERK